MGRGKEKKKKRILAVRGQTKPDKDVRETVRGGTGHRLDRLFRIQKDRMNTCSALEPVSPPSSCC